MAKIKKKSNKQKMKYPFLNSTLAMVLLVPALILSSLYLNRQMEEKRQSLEELQKSVNLEKETLIRERDYLQSKIKLFEDESYVMEYAKQKLQQVAPNEILITFPDKTEH